MSKSFKKKNVIKDAGTRSNKFYKKLSSSRVRLETKRRIKQQEYDTMPLARELTNQWDVCDWKSVYSDFELKETHRGMTVGNQYIEQRGEDWNYYYFHWRWYPRVGWYKGKYRFKR
jgi:hypothetical protein